MVELTLTFLQNCKKKLIYVLSALMVFEKHTLLLHLYSQLNMKYAIKCLILVFKKILNFQ